METYDIAFPGSTASQVNNKMRQEVRVPNSPVSQTFLRQCPLLAHSCLISHLSLNPLQSAHSQPSQKHLTVTTNSIQ